MIYAKALEPNRCTATPSIAYLLHVPFSTFCLLYTHHIQFETRPVPSTPSNDVFSRRRYHSLCQWLRSWHTRTRSCLRIRTVRPTIPEPHLNTATKHPSSHAVIARPLLLAQLALPLDKIATAYCATWQRFEDGLTDSKIWPTCPLRHTSTTDRIEQTVRQLSNRLLSNYTDVIQLCLR